MAVAYPDYPFNNHWSYDIEVYPNVFTLATTHICSGTQYYFEISPWRNDTVALEKFMYWMHDAGQEQVGFNNQGYDWPVLNFLFTMIPGGVTNQMIYEKSCAIIFADRETKWDHIIPTWKQWIPQHDLYKINHFDNVNKATSLKMIEFNRRMDNIKDLPYEPGTVLNQEQAYWLGIYNLHDDDATAGFAYDCSGAMLLRKEFGEKYGLNIRNHSDSAIGTEYFKMKFRECGLPTDKGTPRPEGINLGEVIFPYVTFERPEFQAVVNWLHSKTIYQTKEALNDQYIGFELLQYMNRDCLRVRNLPKHVYDFYGVKFPKPDKRGEWSNKLKRFPDHFCLKTYADFITSDHLHVIVDGFQFDFGTGGIHGSINSTIVRTDDNGVIVDVDAASYYPNIGIVNKMYPAHLGVQFCSIYNEVYQERKLYPKSTHKRINKALKLALNSVYGNSNSEFSMFYDPRYTMQTTINGQLMLCMLAEHLMKVPGLELIQINTDGVTYKTPRIHKEHTMNLCRWWEQVTGLELEDVDYKAMYINNVNNYIAEDINGELKNKGSYEYDLASNGLWEKNFSSLIIAKAAEAALVRGENIDDFIRNHDDIHDFMLRTKVRRTDQLVVRDGMGIETPLQRITRYYAANQGGSFYKIMKPTPDQVKKWNEGDHYRHENTGKYEVKNAGQKPSSGKFKLVPVEQRSPTPPNRYSGIDVNYTVADCNDINDFNWNNLNYDYYINEARKLVDPLF